MDFVRCSQIKNLASQRRRRSLRLAGGMEADDIVIRTKEGDDKNYVKRNFDQLQSLTSQKLHIDKSGNVTMEFPPLSGQKS